MRGCRRWLGIGVWVLGCTMLSQPVSATPILIGDTVSGCLDGTTCFTNLFDNDTATVVDPGVEFSGSISDDIVSADFGGPDGLTLTISFHHLATTPHTHSYFGFGMDFDDIDWDGTGIITGLTLLPGNTLPISFFGFGENHLDIDFTTVLFTTRSPETKVAVFRIDGRSVPEPMTLLLLGLGLGALALRRRRAP
jgi:hypothetical protein